VSTKHAEIFAALAAPFHPSDVKQRDGQGRNKLSYITARTVMNRLDEVLGPEGWHFELQPWGDSLIGTLILFLPDGTVVRKSDAGGRAGMKTADDDTKSAASDCLKRCAVLVGIGRSLYGDGQVSFGAGNGQQQPQPAMRPADTRSATERLIDWCAKEGHSGRLQAIARSVYNCQAPELNAVQAKAIYKLIKDSGAVGSVPQPGPRFPIEQRIEEDTRHSQDMAAARASRQPDPVDQVVENIKGAQEPGKNANGNPVKFGWPHSGVSLFAWMKNISKAFGKDVIGIVKDRFPEQMATDGTFRSWPPAIVEEAAVDIAKFVSGWPGYSGEFDKRLPVSLHDLRDKLWTAAGELADALGQQPTTEAIENLIQQTSQSLAGRFGGEVIDVLEACENKEMLEAILEVVESDVKDSKALTAE
jgi:hypothetical protein